MNTHQGRPLLVVSAISAGLAAIPASGSHAQVASPRPAGPAAPAPCPVPTPGPRSPLTEEAHARGLFYTIVHPTIPQATPIGAGAASFADLDLDGDPDIVCVGEWFGAVGIFENDGTGHFIDRSDPGISAPTGAGVIAGDYDADGDLDLFISCFRGDDVMLRNDGGFVFTDTTAQAGVAGSAGTGGGSAFGDINGDGLLDLYVANRTGTNLGGGQSSDDPNRLFVNQGDGSFIDMYTQLGLTTGDETTLVGCFIDFDLDGDADIYEGNDKGTACAQTQNYLYENIGGTFVDITDKSGTESCTDTMAIGIGDFDRNGWPDIYCTQTDSPPGNTLLLNNGDGTFDQRNTDFGVASFALSWGATFYDHDNDADLDIYVCNVVIRDRLYDNPGQGPAVDIGPEMNVHADGKSYNVATADIDADGDLDMLIVRIPGDVELYINHEGEKRNSIALKIMGESPNLHAVGALVDIRVGSDWQISQVLAGGNTYRTQNSLDQHFGLGDACRADEIRVRWPDGQTRSLTNYPANQRYIILPHSRLGDPDGDGHIAAAEIAALLASLGPVRGDSAHFDMNGDGTIDRSDLSRLLARAGG